MYGVLAWHAKKLASNRVDEVIFFLLPECEIIANRGLGAFAGALAPPYLFRAFGLCCIASEFADTAASAMLRDWVVATSAVESATDFKVWYRKF
jgi:hypothetical protein